MAVRSGFSMAQPRTDLLAKSGKCPARPCAFNYIRLELVFRGPYQECSQNANEISALSPELVFREIPGKLVQRTWQSQWFRRWIGLHFPLLKPVGRSVVRIPAPPVCLGFLPPFHLALWLSADVLPVSYSGVRPKPPPADCAGPLPGIGHVDVFIVGPAARRLQIKGGGSVLASMGGSVFPSAEVLP